MRGVGRPAERNRDDMVGAAVIEINRLDLAASLKPVWLDA